MAIELQRILFPQVFLLYLGLGINFGLYVFYPKLNTSCGVLVENVFLIGKIFRKRYFGFLNMCYM